jgi:hypothetical protein
MKGTKPLQPTDRWLTAGDAAPASRAMSREIRDHIGSILRSLHDNVVKEGVPEQFVHLLAELDKPAR